MSVISMFDRKKPVDQMTEQKEDTDLLAIAEKNRKNAERIAKERLAANKAVLRSYRIKH